MEPDFSRIGAKMDPTIFRPATFIERSLYNLSHAMGIGCLLVVVILALFLFDWRTAVISLTAIRCRWWPPPISNTICHQTESRFKSRPDNIWPNSPAVWVRATRPRNRAAMSPRGKSGMVQSSPSAP